MFQRASTLPRDSRGRRSWLNVSSRKDLGFLLAACVLVPLLVAPVVVLYPLYGLVLLIGIAVVMLAARSIVYPVALAGVPALVIGFHGSNPLPGKVVFASLTLWLLIGIGFALMSGRWPSSAAAQQIIAVPFLLTVALTVLLVARLGPGAYPKTKIELFLAQGLPLLAAGILIASRARTFRHYLLLALVMAVANAAVLTDKIFTGQATQAAVGRFTISTTYNPILAGREAAIGVLISVALALSSSSRRSSLLGYAALPLLGTALLASGSRGPLVALLVALVVLVALTLRDPRTRSRLLRVSAAVVLAVIVVSAIVPGSAIHRSASFLFGDASGLSSNGRTQLWSEALRLFYSHPWAGVGTGGFAIYEPVYRYPHNIVLESAAEFGLLGATIMIAFLVLALRTAFRAWSLSRDPDERIGAAFVVAALVATLVNALLSDAIESTDKLWLVVGLAYGLHARLAAQARQADAPPIPRPAA